MPKLNLPANFKARVSQLARLSDPAAEELISALGETAPALDHSALTQRLVGSLTHTSAGDTESLASTLLTLASVMTANNVELPEFVSEVCASLEVKSGKPGDATTEAAVDLTVLGERLTRLLTSKGLMLSAKASLLQREHANVLLDVKVLTDIRPVFHDDIVLSAVLVHQLKLSYLHDNAPHEIYIALDDADLVALKKCVSRAELKAKALRPLITSNHLIDLGQDQGGKA